MAFICLFGNLIVIVINYKQNSFSETPALFGIDVGTGWKYGWDCCGGTDAEEAQEGPVGEQMQHQEAVGPPSGAFLEVWDAGSRWRSKTPDDLVADWLAPEDEPIHSQGQVPGSKGS